MWRLRRGSGRVAALMEFEMGLVDAPLADLLATAAAQPHDPSFVPFVRRAQAGERPDRDRVGRVRLLHRAGPRGARRGRSAGRHRPDHVLGPAGVDRVPQRTPDVSHLRTCKRNRVLAHQAAGRAVVSSATARATAMPRATATSCGPAVLVRICIEAGWPFTRWTEFAEIDAWLKDLLAGWRTDPATLPGPAAHPFFCGPEVWGDGLSDPPPGAWPPRHEASEIA